VKRAPHTAFVVGADSPLGRACCERLLTAGCRHLVALCDTRDATLPLQADGATIEVPQESLDGVIGVARVLDLLRQRAPWDAIVLVSALRGAAAPADPAADGAALRARLRREIEVPLLIANAAAALAAAQGAPPSLWLVPPHAAGPVGAAAAAACTQYVADLAALSRSGGLRARCLPGDDAAVLAALQAALSPGPAAAAR
jgi:NAD(P)-dependent dehydrogenase (short-subunit alcohol dehydrogenase family)